MCQECKRRAAQIPPDVITAIEAHRAEIIDVMTMVNSHANPEEIARTRADQPNSKTTDADMALVFAPYAVGFLIGQINGITTDSADDCMALLSKGISDGAAYRGSRGVH